MKKKSIEEAAKAAAEAAQKELARLGYPHSPLQVSVSAYTDSNVGTYTLTSGNIPAAQSMGGYMRASSLTPDTRAAIARKAANARWGKARDNGDGTKEEDEEGQAKGKA